MNFQEFKTNVQKWATERGIYEHSTAEAQLIKALSELGELADAIIKGDRDGIKDGVGDVAVCLVNASTMQGQGAVWDGKDFGVITNKGIGYLASYIGQSISGDYKIEFDTSISLLMMISSNNGFTINECFAQAWNEIKDRKGCMVPGGAFVKDAA